MSINHQRDTHKAMSRTPLTLIGAGFLATAAAATRVNLASAGESAHPVGKADHAVFVQGNELEGNPYMCSNGGDDGKLTAAGEYATGGNGGDQIDAPTDSLASQGSPVYDDRSGMLLALNAGSGTGTSFRAQGQKLTDRRVVDSGASSRPASRCQATSRTS